MSNEKHRTWVIKLDDITLALVRSWVRRGDLLIVDNLCESVHQGCFHMVQIVLAIVLPTTWLLALLSVGNAFRMMLRKLLRNEALWVIVLLSILILMLAPVLSSVSAVSAQGHSYTWSEPVILSQTSVGSWFPDLAVDSQERVHIIWENHLEGWKKKEGDVVHSATHIVVNNDGTLSEPNDVFSRWAPSGVIYRLALAADDLGHTYMTVLLGNQVYFLRAASDASHSARAWSEPKGLSGGGVAYMSDIAADSRGTVHVVWQKTVPVLQEDDTLLSLFDIFYRRSEDGGQTWSPLVNLSDSPVSEGKAQIKIDSSDTVYVTWDEGGQGVVVASGTEGTSYRGVLIVSQDGGETWSSPSKFSYPENTNSQVASASNGKGGVLVVWRSDDGLIYYDWSTDGGKSWAPPATIPGILAYSRSGFDAYDMAVDSAGTIHLIAAGQLSEEHPSRGIYHLAWDGSAWSLPVLIYNSEQPGQDPLVGMYPKIVVSQGNRLHAVWHTHADSDYSQGRYIWYSTSQSMAPPQPLLPTPTSTPVPSPTSSAGLIAKSTATPTPELMSAVVPPGVPDVIFTENDDVLLMLQSLIPVILIIAAVIIGRHILPRR
jgi:hypothetical protein